MANFRYRSFSHFSETRFEGDVTTLLAASIVVPSGQIQPQKKRPRNGVSGEDDQPGPEHPGEREILDEMEERDQRTESEEEIGLHVCR